MDAEKKKLLTAMMQRIKHYPFPETCLSETQCQAVVEIQNKPEFAARPLKYINEVKQIYRDAEDVRTFPYANVAYFFDTETNKDTIALVYYEDDFNIIYPDRDCLITKKFNSLKQYFGFTNDMNISYTCDTLFQEFLMRIEEETTIADFFYI
jgi:hypothetical protein